MEKQLGHRLKLGEEAQLRSRWLRWGLRDLYSRLREGAGWAFMGH